MRRLKVLIVAGLTRNRPEVAGGQATEALVLVDSGLRDHVDFLPVDSTTLSVPAPPVLVRLGIAVRRLARFVHLLPESDAVLIYMADGLGFAEKTLMCAIARWAGRGAVLRPGSGTIPAQCRDSRIMDWVLRQALSHANCVCAQSESWLRFFNSYPEAEDKIYEVPNPVVVPAAMDRSSTRTRPPRILFCGTLSTNKGVYRCLQVLKQVREVAPDCELVFAGPGPEFGRLPEAAAASGLRDAVVLKGPVSREGVFSLLRESDVFLFPSQYEGLPNAVLEALAYGLPVVATRVGGLPDLIRHEVNGFLFEVADVEGMAHAVIRLLQSSELARTIGDRGRQTVIERHSVERVWRIFARLLCRAAYEAGRRPTILYEPWHEKEPYARQVAVD